MKGRQEIDFRAAQWTTRRTLLGRMARGVGQIALGTLLASARTSPGIANMVSTADSKWKVAVPRAKRVIYLFQSGGPSHVDLFDHKRAWHKHHGQELPDSVRGNQRVTGMTAGQSSFAVVKPISPFRQCGESGLWLSDLLPHAQRIADKITVIKSLNTEAINHDPAITFINTGSQQIGKASLGAWLSYGLGSENENLPAYVVLLSQGTGKNPGQPLFSRLWGNGFLPANHQGVKLRPGKNPVLYLDNPPGISRDRRRAALDDLAVLNQMHAQEFGDLETLARIEAYEMAYRMQSSVPQLMDLSDEPSSTFELYGPDSRKPGSFAANCLLARRLAERNVRFIQLFHRGWDQHIAIREQLPRQCRDVDQASAALITDLEQRGLLEDTLVIWGGEFGRTVYSQGDINSPAAGRDHHGRCFSIWMAGGGIRAGSEFGQTDDFCYNVVENPVHIRDLNATLLHCLGIDHRQFVYRFRGLDERLTGVEPARVVKEILA